MKKIFILSSVFALTLSFASCKKECSCESFVNGVSTSKYIVEDHKGKCKDLNSNITLLGVTTEVKCK